MLSALRSRLTYANVVATLALVFAMSGGALAASHYLITSTKQISPKVLKQLKGKDGAAGLTGAAGAAGKEGSAGKEGKEGANGESVTAAEVKPGESTCNDLGGSKFTVGGKETTACNGSKGKEGKEGKAGESVTPAQLLAKNGSGHCEEGGAEFKVGTGTATYACNGSPWTAGGTLPAEKTETGTWSFSTGESKHIERVSISLPIPLAAELPAEECGTGGSQCHIHVRPVTFPVIPSCEGKSEPEKKECEEENQSLEAVQKATEADCPGSVVEPKAEPGNLCIYIQEMEHALEEFVYGDADGRSGVGTTGVVLGIILLGEEGGTGEGTWAVAAEKSS
jgi:hypothetical protein